MRSTSPFWQLVRRLRAARLWCERARKRARIVPRYRPAVVMRVAGLVAFEAPRGDVLERALALACPEAPLTSIRLATSAVGSWPDAYLAVSTPDELRYARRALAATLARMG